MDNYNELYTGIFDSHAHYDDDRFEEDQDEILASLKSHGVCGVIDVGCDVPSSQNAVALSRYYDYFYAAVGYHPHEAKSYTEQGFAEIKRLLQLPKTVALGEIGLDYHYDASPREQQQEVFDLQLAYAKEQNIPIIIHSREATQDTLRLLQKYPGLTGVVHCFSGSAETARELVKMGFYIGFTGSVTFKNARKVVEACAAVPLDRLLLETDCPYMAPVPFRGKRCNSTMIAKTAECMAELHGVAPQQMIDIARENTVRLFSLDSIEGAHQRF